MAVGPIRHIRPTTGRRQSDTDTPDTRSEAVWLWGAGFAIGAAAWDNAFDWGGHDINVNANRNNFTNINNNFNSNRANNISNNRSNWQHNAADRRGANYRDTATREKFGKTNTAAADARRQSRGFDQASVTNQLQQRGGNQGQLGQQRGNQGQLGQQRPSQGQLTQQLGQQRGNEANQFGQQRGNAGNQFAQNRSNAERRGQTSSFQGVGNGAAHAPGKRSWQLKPPGDGTERVGTWRRYSPAGQPRWRWRRLAQLAVVADEAVVAVVEVAAEEAVAVVDVAER